MKEFIEPQINADALREKIFNHEVIEGREGFNLLFFMNSSILSLPKGALHGKLFFYYIQAKHLF